MFKYLYINKTLFILKVLVYFLSPFATVASMLIVGNSIDAIINGAEVNTVIFTIMGIGLFIVFQQYLQKLIDYKYRTNLSLALEKELVEKLISREETVSVATNIYISKINNFLDNYVSSVFTLPVCILGLLISVYVSASISLVLIIGVIVAVVLTIAFNNLFQKYLGNLFKANNDAIALNMNAINSIYNFRSTVNIFGAENFAFGKLNKYTDIKIKAFSKYMFGNNNVNILNNFLLVTIQFVALIIALLMAYRGDITVGEAIILNSVIDIVASMLFEIVANRIKYNSSKKVCNELAEILSYTPERAEIIETGDIEFKNLGFTYTTEKFIDNLNLTFEKGKRYLIIGESGSGKSTILKLILKKENFNSGEILLNNIPYNKINKPTLYSKISYVGQQVEILTGDLKENILLDKPFDEARFNSIIKLLNLDYLKDSLNDELTEKVDNFSGGELQRIAIARMIYDDSEIFIFDEFTSALDKESAYIIEKELLKIKDKTLINVSHRIHADLARAYDEVIIMEKGAIKSKGHFDIIPH